MTPTPPFSGFADMAEHYAQVTQALGYESALAEINVTAQLSVFDDPTQAPMPDPALAEFMVQGMAIAPFDMLADTRLERYADRIAWGVINSLHRVAAQIERDEDDAAKALGELARTSDPSEIFTSEVEEAQRVCHSLMEARAARATMPQAFIMSRPAGRGAQRVAAACRVY